MFVLLAILITIVTIPTIAMPLGLAGPVINVLIESFQQYLDVLQNILQTLF